ncbi:MAG: diguanylate cyclase [Candidatus Hydrogenedentes bacterium]|nr:diguanylate cyclase [Candidatus Hydrogenedentota bacterium]
MTSEPEQNAGVSGQANLASKTYSQYRILVADDQESIIHLLEQVVVTRLGATVRVVTNGDDLLDSLRQDPYDLVITDMVMPGVSGLELVRQARQLRPDTDIIVMTGYAADFPYVDAMQAGAFDFMSKPFLPSEVEAKAIRALHERELRRARLLAESKYRSLFDLSTEGMALLGAPEYRIQEANQTFCDLTARSCEELEKLSVLDLLDENDRMRLQQWLEFVSVGGKGTIADLTLLQPSGRGISVDLSVTFVTVQSEKVLFMAFRDVTERREVEKQLAEAAQKDGLTGLLNKRSFQTRIEWAVSQARDRQIPVSLVLLDLDNFKRCNDTYGHQKGDEVLTLVGDVLFKSIRTTNDEGFRLGGDEFAIILVGADQNSSQRVAERIQSTFRKAETFGTSISIGIAQFQAGFEVESFIRSADEALYRAKAAGKDGIQLS